MTAFVRILSYVRVSGISKMATYKHKCLRIYRECDRSVSGAKNGAERTENRMSGSGAGAGFIESSGA